MRESIKPAADAFLRSLGVTISDHQGVCAIAPTGERYVVLESLGVREECARTDPKDTTASKEAAISAYMEALSHHSSGKTGTVYWRHWPEVESHYHGWKVYSRILISDKPEVDNAEQAA